MVASRLSIQVFALIAAWASPVLTSAADLPTAPAGWHVRLVAPFPENVVRLTSDGAGKTLYTLSTSADVFRLDIATGRLDPIWKGPEYAGGNLTAIGICLDPAGRLYVVTNQQDDSVKPGVNHVRIFRGRPDEKPTVWFQVDYPYGVDTFNHGVSMIAIGPDGLAYVSSGSRTDHGEPGHESNRATVGEVDGVTACFWRLDPKSDHPTAEVYARGLRNAFGFGWDDDGALYATENGPNAEAPEEINRITPGAHYGFPYRFANLDHKLYPDQPDAPPNLVMTPPAAELDNHSSPSAILWLGQHFPPRVRGAFLVARFGNLIQLPAEVGFDILLARPQQGGHLSVSPFMSHIGRVTDLHASGGKVFIAVYDAQLINRGGAFDGNAHILELSPDP